MGRREGQARPLQRVVWGHLKVAATLVVGALWARLYVNADDRFAQRAQGFEAGVAEFEAELVFTFCVESALALVAGGIGWTLVLFSYVDVRMDLERAHNLSPLRIGARAMPDWDNSLDCWEKT